MLWTIVLITLSAVFMIGIVTSILNAKVPCDHDWIEDETHLKCPKCLKGIDRLISDVDFYLNYSYYRCSLTVLV